jgi:SAM-dependent methyltransferase
VTALPNCRLCGAALAQTLVDLGSMPLANRLLTRLELSKPEPRYPLHARVCGACFLVQVDNAASSEDIFSDYTYFSSYSQSWVAHARAFANMARDRFALGKESRVIEIASNDGYLLKNFVEMGIPCLGIEPAANVAKVAVEAGVPTEVKFFGTETARDLAARGLTADLIVGNNVLAHVPDPNDFIAGLAIAVKPEGVLSFEFPHLQNLMREVQFDTIYHEHFSYLTLHVVTRAFRKHGLEVFDVERLPTHGGSLRVFAAPAAAGRTRDAHVDDVLHGEISAGLESLSAYRGYSGKVKAVRDALRAFLLDARAKGQKVAAYGAAAKGATLLNYSNVTTDLIAFAADRSPHKQNRFMPGSHIPILPPESVIDQMPDYLLILPWNLRKEIMGEMDIIREWGGRFVTAIPRLEILP